MTRRSRIFLALLLVLIAGVLLGKQDGVEPGWSLGIALILGGVGYFLAAVEAKEGERESELRQRVRKGDWS